MSAIAVKCEKVLINIWRSAVPVQMLHPAAFFFYLRLTQRS